MSAAKAVDQSVGPTSGTAPSRPDRRGGPRSPDNRSSRRTGGRADHRARAATDGGGFRRFLGAHTR